MQPVAIVTGASSGLGEALAPLLARNGYRVFGASRRSVSLPGVTPLVMDVTNEVAIQAAIQTVLEATNRLDLIVHCAGIGGGGPVEHMPLDRARRIMDTNFWGSYMLCQHGLPHLLKAPAGKLLIVGSIGGYMGIPFRAAYCASKGALVNLVESLRHEVANTDLQVALIAPGDMATNSFTTQYRVPHQDVHPRYRRRYQAADDGMRDHVQDGMDAIEVAERILAILRKDKLAPHYVIGAFTQRISPLAKRLLPGRWWEKILGGYYR